MSRIKSSLISVLFSSSLCSCDWRQGSEKWFEATPQNEIISYYTGICQEFGFQIGTSPMAECIQVQINNQKKEHAEARAKRAQSQKIDDLVKLEPGWSFKYTFSP